MDEDESLRRHGLRPAGRHLDEVRELLNGETRKERQAQGCGSTELMKLCCVQLFNVGSLDDVLSVWRAKTSSMDADCSVDIQLLCGAGVAETKAFLGAQRSEEAHAALDRLIDCESAGDFEDFSIEEYSALYAVYYGNVNSRGG